MKLLITLLGALVVLAPSGSTVKGVELKLKAPNFIFMPPPPGINQKSSVTVRVTARLEGEFEDPEKYYCLDEEWEWADGTRPSVHEVDCDPYEEGMEINRRFSGSRTYRDPGSYNIMLRLKHGKKTIIAGKARIRIRG